MESVERVWVLRAIDERWQRHLVEMQVLRNSVNVRAFGQLDPMEEYRIDGARSFVDMVRDMRRKTLAHVFFFVGSAVEPVMEFDEEEVEKRRAAEAAAEAAAVRAAAAAGGTPISEAFARDDDARLREREEVLRARENDEVVAKTMIMRKPGEEEDGGGKGGER